MMERWQRIAACSTVALAGALRIAGHWVVVAPGSRSLRRQMRYADAQSARFALILGDRDLERGLATLRPLDGGAQIEVRADVEPISAVIAAE